MRGLLKAVVFLSLATALHAAAFIGFGGSGLPEGAGSRGAALVTLTPAAPGLAAEVARWTAAPEVADRARRAPAAPRVPAGIAPSVAALDSAPPARSRSDVTASAPDSAALDPASLTAPPPPPAPERAAAPGQRAAGSGQGATRGSAAEGPSAAETARRQALMAAWGAEVRTRIERYKPASGLGASGRTVLRISVLPDGRLAGAEIVQSSRNARLDRAALGAVRRAGRLPAAPEGLRADIGRFDLPVTFTR